MISADFSQIRKHKCYLLSLWAVLILAGCTTGKVTIEQRRFPLKNPVSYEFNASIDTVKEAINEAHGKNSKSRQGTLSKLFLAWKGNAENWIATEALDGASANVSAYIYGMGSAVGKSKVYLKDGEELKYFADFLIQLIPISPSKTRVEITTEHSQVLAGTEFHPFVRAGIWVEVEATSIEQYQILLDIGTQLGVQDMPILLTPETNSPTLKVKMRRT